MLGDCNMFSFDSVPSSTFWLVVVFLFVSILAVFDLLTKNKQEFETYSKDLNEKVSCARNDINSAHIKIIALEKKTESYLTPEERGPSTKKVKAPSPKKIEIVESESESESEID